MMSKLMCKDVHLARAKLDYVFQAITSFVRANMVWKFVVIGIN